MKINLSPQAQVILNYALQYLFQFLVSLINHQPITPSQPGATVTPNITTPENPVSN